MSHLTDRHHKVYAPVIPFDSDVEAASAQGVHVTDVDGNTYMDGQPVRVWMLQSRIRDQLESGASESVLVIADDSVPTRRLVEVVDQARLGGATDVGVATEREVGR